MNLIETFFVNGQPVGVIRLDSNTGRFHFSPVRGKSPLPEQEWRNVDELKSELIAHYRKGARDGP